MADLIKKIKIKKQDGTFTDYIPIGADAANVETSDGESVELKLNKKPYYYDAIADMKADTKLKAGDVVQTLGYYEANDGGGAEYQIVNNSELVDDGGSVHELNNGLKAVLIENDKIDKSYIIQEISQNSYYNENGKTTYYISHIPHLDEKGKKIEVKHGFANDVVENTEATETPSEFSKRKKATLVTNASIFDTRTESAVYNKIFGLIIHNNTIVTDTRAYYPTNWYKARYILALNANDILETYEGNYDAQTLISNGIKETWQAFTPIMINGENCRSDLLATNKWDSPGFTTTSDVSPVKDKIYFILEDGEYIGKINLTAFESGTTYYEQTAGTRYKRCIIAQNSTNKDIFFLNSEGSGVTENLGLTMEECITILKDKGCDFAYQLDEGGSTQVVYKNIKSNHDSDDPTTASSNTTGYGTTERLVPDFIYFAKESKVDDDININNIYAELNYLKTRLRKLEIVLQNNNASNNSNFNINSYQASSSNLGITFSRTVSGTKTSKVSIIADASNNERGISFYDEVAAKTLFKFANDGSIIANYVKLATLLDVQTNASDIDNLGFNTGFTKCTTSVTSAPFSSYNAFIIQMALDSDQKMQFAFPLASNPTEIKYRTRTKTNDVFSWKAWKTISLS